MCLGLTVSGVMWGPSLCKQTSVYTAKDSLPSTMTWDVPRFKIKSRGYLGKQSKISQIVSVHAMLRKSVARYNDRYIAYKGQGHLVCQYRIVSPSLQCLRTLASICKWYTLTLTSWMIGPQIWYNMLHTVLLSHSALPSMVVLISWYLHAICTCYTDKPQQVIR